MIGFLATIFFFSGIIAWVLSKGPFKKYIFPVNLFIWLVLFFINPSQLTSLQASILSFVLLPVLMGIDVIAFRHNLVSEYLRKISPIVTGLFSFFLGLALIDHGFFSSMGSGAIMFMYIIPANFIIIFVLNGVVKEFSF